MGKVASFWGPNSRPGEAADFSCSPLMQNTEVLELIQAKMQIRASENSTKGILAACWIKPGWVLLTNGNVLALTRNPWFIYQLRMKQSRTKTPALKHKSGETAKPARSKWLPGPVTRPGDRLVHPPADGPGRAALIGSGGESAREHRSYFKQRKAG